MDYIVFFGLLLIGVSIGIIGIVKNKKREIPISPYYEQYGKCESPIERSLFNSLWDSGIYPECQFPVGRYRLDMAIVDLRIAIECDGKAYHSTPSQKRHDRARTAFLNQRGWIVLRFSGKAIYSNPRACVSRIRKEMEKR